MMQQTLHYPSINPGWTSQPCTATANHINVESYLALGDGHGGEGVDLVFLTVQKYLGFYGGLYALQVCIDG